MDDFDDDYRPYADSINFANRFKTFQNIVKFSSPFSIKQQTLNNNNSSLFADNTSTSTSTVSQPQVKKLSAKTKTRITPIIKEKQQTSNSTGSSSSTSSSKREKKEPDIEGVINPRNRDYLDDLLTDILSTREHLDKETIAGWVDEFCQTYKVKFPKSRDKVILVLIYCTVMSCRLNGVYLDIHLLSIELDIPFKNITGMINDHLPPLTSKNPEDMKLISVVIETPRTKLSDEYCRVMKRIVEEFPNSDLQVSDGEIKDYKESCEEVFDILEKDISCEYERQFCVTPDKVYIYGIFEVIHRKKKPTTERAICDYLSSRFKIPRVTVEKMKRLVVKCRA